MHAQVQRTLRRLWQASSASFQIGGTDDMKRDAVLVDRPAETRHEIGRRSAPGDVKVIRPESHGKRQLQIRPCPKCVGSMQRACANAAAGR